MKKIYRNRITKTNRKSVIVLIILGIVLSISIPLMLHCLGNLGENAAIFTVNGETIIAREYRQELLDKRAEVYRYFYNKYNVEDSENFWTTAYGGEIPEEVAQKMAVDEVINMKIQQQIALQKGIVKDISYSAFLKDFKESSKARKKSVAETEVVFGPDTYGERQYYDYKFREMVIELKKKLKETDFKIEENDIKEYYESNKETIFKLRDNLKVQRIYISYFDNSQSEMQKRKTEVELRMKEIKAGLERGDTPVKYVGKGLDGFEVQVVAFDDLSYNEGGTDYPNILAEVDKLKTGSISQLVEEGYSYNLLKVLSRVPMGYKTYEDEKEGIKSFLYDKKYNEMVDSLVKEAIVVYNDSNIKKIKPY